MLAFIMKAALMRLKTEKRKHVQRVTKFNTNKCTCVVDCRWKGDERKIATSPIRLGIALSLTLSNKKQKFSA